MCLHLKTRRLAGRVAVALCVFALLPVFGAGQADALGGINRAIYRGEYERAAAAAEAYLKTHPRSAPARVLLARAKLARGEFPEAFEDLRLALRADPANVDALYYLGTLSTVLSEAEYKRLYALAPDSPRVHQLLAEAAEAQGDTAGAEAEYLAALKAHPQSVELLVALGELTRTNARLDDAIGYYRRAEVAGGLDFDIAYGLGACYSIKQEHERAGEYFRRAVAFEPQDAAARFALGLTFFQLGKVEAAIAELKTAVTIEPQMRQAYFLLGRAYRKLGQTEAAQAAVKKAQELAAQQVASEQGTSVAAPAATDDATPTMNDLPTTKRARKRPAP